MKILAIEKAVPGADHGRSDTLLLQEEAKCAWRLHQSGQIRELYFRSDKDEAILVLECDTVDQATSVLSTLPLVREGLIEFEVIPLKAYPGFGRLFVE